MGLLLLICKLNFNIERSLKIFLSPTKIYVKIRYRLAAIFLEGK